MSWPFLYVEGDRLSPAELSSARLDGDLVEVGEAYMPTDAVETRELRAASLRHRVPGALALTRGSAAWVHGAVAEAPSRHTVQRYSVLRVPLVVDARLRYSDQLLPRGAAVRISGVWVTTPAFTLGDLARAMQAGENVSPDLDALIAWRPGLLNEAIDVLERGRSHHKRPAIAYLREYATAMTT